jgi:hypothetical protein
LGEAEDILAVLAAVMEVDVAAGELDAPAAYLIIIV